jgi:hypothetical protein
MRSTFPSASYPACGDDRMYDVHHGLPGQGGKTSVSRTSFSNRTFRSRLSRVRSPGLQLAVQRVRHVPDLNHLGHVTSRRACHLHVEEHSVSCILQVWSDNEREIRQGTPTLSSVLARQDET